MDGTEEAPEDNGEAGNTGVWQHCSVVQSFPLSLSHCVQVLFREVVKLGFRELICN